MNLKRTAQGWIESIVAKLTTSGVLPAKGRAKRSRRAPSKKRAAATALGLSKSRKPRAKKRAAPATTAP